MIKYKFGDATLPQENGKVMIAHGCNNQNKWGAGFVVPLSNRYPLTKELYHVWSTSNKQPQLGEFQIVKINDNLSVANMITQSGVYNLDWLIPFRYQSFTECLIRLNKYLIKNNFTNLVMPRIGAGLGGADWKLVEKIINKVFDNSGISVTIYDIEVWEGTIYDE